MDKTSPLTYRYSFPVPRNGEIFPFAFYVQAEHQPRREDLVNLLEKMRLEADKQGNTKTISDCENAIFALNHLIGFNDFPQLPPGCGIPLQCKTAISTTSAITLNIIKPYCLSSKENNKINSGQRLRLTKEG